MDAANANAKVRISAPVVHMKAIHPIILCGGSGTRLWPVSIKARPKPFLPLIGETSLFEQACSRVAQDPRFADPIIVAGAVHEGLIAEQMGSAPHRLIIEPAAKNTAPAIALAAAVLEPDAIMLVCPSDHYIANAAAFREAALAAASLAAQDHLTAFGITADRPETGYGYIRKGQPLDGGFAVAQFVEKPDLERAKSYLASGEYSWNGGIFAFRAGAFLDALAEYRPAMAEAVKAAVTKSTTEGKTPPTPPWCRPTWAGPILAIGPLFRTLWSSRRTPAKAQMSSKAARTSPTVKASWR